MKQEIKSGKGRVDLLSSQIDYFNQLLNIRKTQAQAWPRLRGSFVTYSPQTVLPKYPAESVVFTNIIT